MKKMSPKFETGCNIFAQVFAATFSCLWRRKCPCAGYSHCERCYFVRVRFGAKRQGKENMEKYSAQNNRGQQRELSDEFTDLSVDREYLFKVLLIGDPGVGKTSFVQRYTNNVFRSDYKGTVGVDFALKILRVDTDTMVKLQLWDVAGQERFTWMTRVYYRDSRGCIILFDLTNRASFDNVVKWKRDLDAKCQMPDGGKVPCLLLANKCDLRERSVSLEEMEDFYRKHDFIGWTETSAKDDTMVKDSVKFLVDTMLKQQGQLAAAAAAVAAADGDKAAIIRLGRDDGLAVSDGCAFC